MIIKITFENDDGEVLLRGGSTTGSVIRAQQELEQMAQNWMKMLTSGEVCELCENTGVILIEDAPDQIRQKSCPHLLAEKVAQEADNKIHDA